MAFKTNTFAQTAAIDPAAHFKTLTKRQFPDVMPHQKEMLEAYAKLHETSPDVALQLPTGSGKTLVGLLIADWRRLKFGDRVVYLCPTRQLVSQTVYQARAQYGINVVDLSGRRNNFSPKDSTAYKTGAQIAVSTYSGLFNTHPFFEDPNLIIIDDAHSAENYIASMWSLQISAETPLHTTLTTFLRSHIDPQSYARLIGEWNSIADTTWVEKMPSPQVMELESDIISIIDAHAGRENPELHHPWSLLREHLAACHMYLGSREILIRPLIPPTITHDPFAKADQRIFMSATLGAGGDLERLTGRKNISRLPAPDGFQSAGVGRRFFVFPSLSLTGEETDALRLSMQKRAGRSVILTTTTQQAESHATQVNKALSDFTVYKKDNIEVDKTPFVEDEKAVAILANRYDGIDFPGEECRLLCVDGLPRAMNIQERFIMSKMGASALYNERIQTRVLQAVGRCTRALQDRSAVFVTGIELVDFLADKRKWRHFHPELQAELSFGVDQSTSVDFNTINDNFDMFMENNADWSAADSMIRNALGKFHQDSFPAMEELEAVTAYEVAYQESMWHQDYTQALTTARTILGSLNHSELRGYRALWHYLAGVSALKLSNASDDQQAKAAREQFTMAKKAAPSISWLNTLARTVGGIEDESTISYSGETLKQVEALEQQFLKMGTATNHKFEKQANTIQAALSKPNTFETAQVELGLFLGLSAGNAETQGAPDPWWLGENLGLVFETHADAQEGTVFGATKARQVSGHPNWIKQNIPGANKMEIIPVLVTPCKQLNSGAVPHLEHVRYWDLKRFCDWVTNTISELRDLKGSFPGDGDLVWRLHAGEKLEAKRLTIESLLGNLPLATEVMETID